MAMTRVFTTQEPVWTTVVVLMYGNDWENVSNTVKCEVVVYNTCIVNSIKESTKCSCSIRKLLFDSAKESVTSLTNEWSSTRCLHGIRSVSWKTATSMHYWMVMGSTLIIGDTADFADSNCIWVFIHSLILRHSLIWIINYKDWILQ